MTEDLIKEVEATVSPVYLVGGSVRDILLEREPKDYDFCTPLEPDEIEAKVKKAGRRAYLTGKKFGTIGFKCQGQFIEVTTFRSERYNPGSRKPEVEFVQDLKQDLSRRDFTINSIALKDGEYFDPFGGRLDILARKIKAVGEATDRFKEDPLRVLRAARLAAQLGFYIDPNMVGKAKKIAHSITTVSRERWVQELDKLLIAPNAKEGLSSLNSMNVLRFMLPEVFVLISETDWFDSLFVSEPELDERWAELLMQTGRIASDPFTKAPKNEIIGVEIVTGICARLKFSNERTKRIIEVTRRQSLLRLQDR